MSLLEEDITKKKQVEETTSPLEFSNSRNNGREYEVKAIRDSRIYARELDNYPLRLYY